MVKSLIARLSRWIRKTSDKYCTLDIDKNARGLANCLVRSPLTAAEKTELLKEAILKNVDECDREKVLSHFRKLSMESDPSKDDESIPNDSVKKIGTELPSVNELAKTFDGIDHETNRKKRIALFDQRLDAKKNAENFIKNCTDCGGDVMKNASSKSARVLDDLSKKGDHLERLSCEIDPLVDVEEIQENSVQSGLADIKEIGIRSSDQLPYPKSLDYDSEIKRRG